MLGGVGQSRIDEAGQRDDRRPVQPGRWLLKGVDRAEQQGSASRWFVCLGFRQADGSDRREMGKMGNLLPPDLLHLRDPEEIGEEL